MRFLIVLRPMTNVPRLRDRAQCLVGRRPRRRRRKQAEDQANGELGRRRRRSKPIETPAVGDLSEEDPLLAEQYADGTIPI